ncbi:MAG TPA: XTP/dITP diphosphatase [Smithella sp.]|jgi:XTP/dITP diphosphohydrolase|nr:XTP/dITP diphosphatase [Smithella sp.]HOE31914.1 XTP/dITP diphosphatase [Smithella sp.]HOG09953.1 XTP/dITP diphosphatase [Smithella sp.]HOO34739.1 XTP/dITP diphosphatase [Smithella sp.]HOS14159.1 XTP/dITP diphosphatase [Smithella sp.]
MKIVFASGNLGKVREIREMLSCINIELVSLKDYPDIPEIVEDGKTFLENALKKARTVSERTAQAVLADDSGLQVDALGGEPGIYSARYAGEGASDDDNINLLLEKLKEVPPEKRTASFCCVLVLYNTDGTYESFESRWPGRIIDDRRGDNGFGYDPVFYVPELNKTAAELPPEIKNRISHRGQSFLKLKQSLGRKMKK